MKRVQIRTTVSGPIDAPTALFVHGWPDSSDLWQEQVARLSSQYKCICVDLPNFADPYFEAHGLDFHQLAHLIKEAVSSPSSGQRENQFHWIGHDWGAYLGYVFESLFPNQVQSMITMDVGARFKGLRFSQAAFYIGYQGWLISAWLLGHRLPGMANKMTQFLARVAKAPRPDRATFQMNELYFRFWISFLANSQRTLLQNVSPRCPLLYIYGLQKPVSFHSREWIQTLEQRNDCKIVRMPKAGHWMMRDCPGEVTALIENWLSQQTKQKKSSQQSGVPQGLALQF